MVRLSILTLLLSLSLLFPSSILAQTTVDWKTQNPLCVGPPSLFGMDTTDVPTIKGIECLFFNALQVIVYIAGVAFLFMFITGGFKYLFSSGDSKKVAIASSTLTMSFLGLIGIIASWLILQLITTFTGVNVIDFIIPSN